MFRNRRFIFRKTVVYTVMLWYDLNASSISHTYTVRFTCISISSVYTVRCTCISKAVLILMHVKRNMPCRHCVHNRLPENEPSISKYIEDIKKIKIKY